MKVKSKSKNTTTKKRSSYGGPKPLCNQDPEMEDCFNRSVRGKCGALTVADYPCGHCPFYKPAPLVQKENRRTYARLIRLERVLWGRVSVRCAGGSPGRSDGCRKAVRRRGKCRVITRSCPRHPPSAGISARCRHPRRHRPPHPFLLLPSLGTQVHQRRGAQVLHVGHHPEDRYRDD